MNENGIVFITSQGAEKTRLDQTLVNGFHNNFSRAFCQKLIKEGCVAQAGKIINRPSELIVPGVVLSVTLPQKKEECVSGQVSPYSIDIQVIYENQHFAIINKPAGLLTHAAGTAPGEVTLTDWVRQQFPEATTGNACARPGIVHRLDRDTSGLMVIVKTPEAYLRFSNLFKNRLISKCYHAVVEGEPISSGTIDWNIVRHPRNRLLMTHSRTQGRIAVTRYKVLEYFQEAALIEAFPETGRTHQIRVHCAAMGHPIVGDPLYHKTSPLIKRHALHATKLSFTYDGQLYEFSCPYPDDMQKLMRSLDI